MHLNNSDQSSSVNSALGIVFAAFFTFVIGYSASRVFLGNKVNTSTTNENLNVVPHQSTLWDPWSLVD